MEKHFFEKDAILSQIRNLDLTIDTGNDHIVETYESIKDDTNRLEAMHSRLIREKNRHAEFGRVNPIIDKSLATLEALIARDALYQSLKNLDDDKTDDRGVVLR